LKKSIILTLFIIILLCTYPLSADNISEFIKKLEQKSNTINTLFASILTNGFDQDNNPVPLYISYWKDKSNIKKVVIDEAETVTTIITGDTFLVHYSTAGILIKNNISKLNEQELKQFRFQNFILDYYKLKDILKKYKIKNFEKHKYESLIFLEDNNKKEKIEIVFENKTLNLKQIAAEIFTDGVDKLYKFNILFKEFKINKPIDASVFDYDLSGVKGKIDESDFD